MSSKNAENAFAKKNKNEKMKNLFPKDQIQQDTQLVHTAKELIIQWTCAGMVQMRLIDLKGAKLKILNTQRTTV